ncbi:uncharacterized protein PAC_00032 [Phialocephala subalpina]|uniref:CorA-like transporter domain-containing protein n=1 Tax=Phialocephala subalpina TaxID=576137 RepID=A0A1L7WBK2_9HELO|nr:uncharacterized protein PAC_00032 [Phialocephala subalpina]
MTLVSNEKVVNEIFDDTPIATDKREYLSANFPTEDAFVHDSEQYTSRLSTVKTSIFCSSEKFNVDVSDITTSIDPESPSERKSHTFHQTKALEEHIHTSATPYTRFISICSPSSLKPFRITESAMTNLLTHHHIGSEFLDLLFSFGDKPRNAEVGLGSMTIKSRADESYDIQYLISYVEQSNGIGSRSWTMRQVGVFHHFVPSGPGSLWIILHAKPNTRLQQRMEAALSQWQKSSSRPQVWHLMHLLVLSTYLNNWRWYLRSLSEEFEKIADIVLTLDFSKPREYAHGLQMLLQLQHLEDKVLPLAPRFRASLATVQRLKEMNSLFNKRGFCSGTEFRHLANETTKYESQLKAHWQSVELLEKRAQEILKPLSVALNLKNQATVVEISNNMLSLTKDTVDDSATVRVITVVTLIYLPASFVASLLGTNLFVFQGPNGSGFTVSGQFWIYVVLTVPLTILTIGSCDWRHGGMILCDAHYEGIVLEEIDYALINGSI